MIDRSCVLCDGAEASILFESRDHISGESFTCVECNACGLAYINPQPEPASLGDYYPTTHQAAEPAGYEKMDAKPRIKFVSSLAEAGATPTVLDIGCGKGLMLLGLRDQGWNALGTELSDTSRRYAVERGLDVQNCDPGDLSMPDSSCDVITMWHSLVPVEGHGYDRTG